MKLIKTIQFKNFDIDSNKLPMRQAARGIVFDSDKNIGLLHVAKHKYHKLPGGGIEAKEDFNEALKRECLEEIGCDIETFAELGEIIEYRDEPFLEQHSYCYLANVVGEKGGASFTKEELANNFKIKWLPLVEAISVIENDTPNNYEGRFIQTRDLSFLKEALLSIEKPL